MNTSGGAADGFDDPLLEREGGGAAGTGGPVPEPRGETAAASPWWKQWCARIGAGEEGLDPTRTTLALQLQALRSVPGKSPHFLRKYFSKSPSFGLCV